MAKRISSAHATSTGADVAPVVSAAADTHADAVPSIGSATTSETIATSTETATPMRRGRRPAPRLETLKRDRFMLFRAHFEAIDKLPDADAISLFRAVCRYALDGTIPTDLHGTAEVAFGLMEKSLEIGRKYALNGTKSKGIRPQMYGNKNAVKQHKNNTYII